MNLYLIKAAMKKGRPYIVNEVPLPVGYWKLFYATKYENDSWTPPAFRIERKNGKLGDVLGWIGGVPLFSRPAVELLTDASKGRLDFTSFGIIKNEPYWIMSRIPNIESLDISHISDAGPIFCLPGNELNEVLVTDTIPELVVAKKLTGFEFRDPKQHNLKRLFKGENTNVFPGVLP
jgi:hypothetical protein